MISWVRYVHEGRVDRYLELGWMIRDCMYRGEFMVMLMAWPCGCPMVEPK